ncbi:MAG: hypothetical protein QNJ46_04335 [Leptolyngbyaceae cyanobacterium MO_188.B28]|nr:hypothetical protein [Leptolyngbyaceae cyanobacterium MO_188.B28]
MTKKSNTFRELRRLQSKKPQRRQDPLISLGKKLEQNSLPIKLVDTPPGTAKMSKLLEEFIAPHLPLIETKDALEKLVAMGIVAWNIALEPESKHRQMIENVFTDKVFEEEPELKATGEDILWKLIERKKQYFSKWTQRILEYELLDNGNDKFSLSVVSTYPE